MPVRLNSTGGGSVTLDVPSTATTTTLILPITGGIAGSGNVGSSGLTMNTARLLGRTTAGNGALEEITVGSGLTLSGGSLAVSGGGQLQTLLFTSSGSWTVPAGVTQVRATVIGGGGGGGGSQTNSGAGNGGLGGIAVGSYTVTPGSSITVTVGAGGVGTNSLGATGGAGGTSSFGAFLSATGGGGGIWSNGPVLGANGTGSGGTVRNSNMTFSFYFFGGDSTRGNGGSATAAVGWTASSTFHPGARGSGGTLGYSVRNLDSSGGIGGIVYLEWVG